MSRHTKRKKKASKPFNGNKITEVWVDEASSLTPGLWADPEPKHTKPEPVAKELAEEPIEGLVYAKGGILAKNPMGLFGDSFSAMDSDGLHYSHVIGRPLSGTPLSGVKGSLAKLTESFRAIGESMNQFTRNVGPIRVVVDSEMTASQETIDRILGPQKKEVELPAPLKPTELAKAVNPRLNNLCKEVELPGSALPKTVYQVEGIKSWDHFVDILCAESNKIYPDD